ncbi:TorD/DmsD family molecular chaperone [Azospirillum agricola]|uniref:TorD/DmsD family molecular chaperone n=1 Tax=Azospirillum agricola TaxID=1720247 RepID=UPI000A0F1B0E|nr:molecular chaperone TorD family protein [Azospirillum agricola]SMH53754.1 chaperone TorD involved in molybdoenzyme TorA maturation [Azospirillum lipoferum]
MNGSLLEHAPPPPAAPFAPAAAALRRLAAFHAMAPTAEFLTGLRAAPLHGGFGIAFDRDDALQAMALIDEVVSDLPDPIDPDSVAPLLADFTAIHRTLAYRASPLESDWAAEAGQPDPGLAAALRRWQQQAGLVADAGFPPDHLVSELTLLAALLERGQASDATRFLDQHPLRWIPALCSRVATRCREPFYAGVAILTAAHLDHLRDLLAGACGLPRPPDDDSADIRRRRWAEGRLPRTCGCDG